MFRVPSLTKDHQKLAWSLVFNIVSKIPSMAAIFFVLPHIQHSFGTSAYGALLAAIALGTLFAFPLNGINVVGRRLVAHAGASNDHKGEADAFASMIVAGISLGVITALSSAVSASLLKYQGDTIALSAIATAIAYFNIFDSVRAAYNEHFITAIIQIIVQIIIIPVILISNAQALGPLVLGLLLQGALPLASILTGISLLWKRPYLLSGRPTQVQAIVRQGFFVLLSDGVVMALLNLSVVWVNSAIGAQASAWYGTLSRLFQALLTPVLLTLFPVTSYISIKWKSFSVSTRSKLIILFASGSAIYGVIGILAISVLSPIYLTRLMHLGAYPDPVATICVALLFSSVLMQKTYSALVFSIDHAKFFSTSTSLAVLGSAILSMPLALISPAISALKMLGILIALGISITIFSDARVRLKKI